MSLLPFRKCWEGFAGAIGRVKMVFIMLPENELVPYQTAVLPPPPWLVVAPHPDDETLGMGGTLYLASQKGISSKVLIVTDGGAGGNPLIRKKEALKAAEILGFSPTFLDLPDRKTQKYLDIFARKILEVYKLFKTIFLPSPLEFHPDHRLITLTVTALLERADFDGEVWFYEISRQGEVNRLIDISAVISEKERAIRCYESQLHQNAYLEIALALNRARAYTLAPFGARYAEGFFAAPARKIWDLWFQHTQKYFITTI